MKQIAPILKYILLPFVLVIIFNYLEYGLSWDSAKKFIYPIILSLITILNLFLPKVRRYSLLSVLIFFILMIAFYLANQIVLSSVVGSFGFALLIILVISYLPAILEKGHIEKL